MVCVDSGSNRLVLIERDGITHYEPAVNRTLGTIEAHAALIVEGIGRLGICNDAMHVPNASANLLPTYLMSDAECIVSFGKHKGEYYCEIACHQGINSNGDIKYIPTIMNNNVWWITRCHN